MEGKAVLVNMLLLQYEETKLNPNNMLWCCSDAIFSTETDNFEGIQRRIYKCCPTLLSLSKSTITWFGISSGISD